MLFRRHQCHIWHHSHKLRSVSVQLSVCLSVYLPAIHCHHSAWQMVFTVIFTWGILMALRQEHLFLDHSILTEGLVMEQKNYSLLVTSKNSEYYINFEITDKVFI
jgi:hypothetical protein